MIDEQENIINEQDIEHLKWIHARLVNIHGESEYSPYMYKLRHIINKLDGNDIEGSESEV